MGPGGLVRLRTFDPLLPRRIRALIILGLAILAWLPIIALGYAITVRL